MIYRLPISGLGGAVLLAVLVPCSWALTVWPAGTGPCSTTLQACIDASPAFETIQINSNETIFEDIFAGNGTSLIAGDGFHPAFSTGSDIFILATGGGTRAITVSGLKLRGGQLRIYKSGGGDMTFNVLRNDIQNDTSAPTMRGVWIESSTDTNLTINVNYNVIVNSTRDPAPFPWGAIVISNTAPGTTGAVSGEIFGNTIDAVGIHSRGIAVANESNGIFDLNIAGNLVRGGTDGGVHVQQSIGTGSTLLDIVSNAFMRHDDFYFPSAVHADNHAGTMELDIINNTMLNSRYGVRLTETGGTLSASVFNNLVANGGSGFEFNTGVTVSNDYNLTFNNSSYTNYVPGGGALNSDPLIRSAYDPRLRVGSPAEDAANGFAYLFGAPDVQLIDADGLYRIKRSGSSGPFLMDIGAFELGDSAFVHTNPGSGSHISAISHKSIDGQPALDNLHVTSNWNPPGSAGVYNNADEGLYDQGGGSWAVFNEQTSALIETGAAFNLAKYAVSANAFLHTASSEAPSSQIVMSGLDGEPGKILQVSQHWTGVYNPHPFGISYAAGNWEIRNLDGAPIPLGAEFNVYYQEPSKSAWQHVASLGNIVANRTILDNPAINGVDCAAIQVTQSAQEGVSNPHPIGVYYSNGTWRIFNQDLVPMPNGAAFHVMVNPEQIAVCTRPDELFSDGFE